VTCGLFGEYIGCSPVSRRCQATDTDAAKLGDSSVWCTFTLVTLYPDVSHNLDRKSISYQAGRADRVVGAACQTLCRPGKY